MKMGYLIGAITITVLLLIIAFQNISTSSQFWMLFKAQSIPMTFPVMLIAALGITAGSLYTIAIQSMLNKKKEVDEDESSGGF